jgi:hypothetical protein
VKRGREQWQDPKEINEGHGKASTFYHLTESSLCNKDIDRKCKITI